MILALTYQHTSGPVPPAILVEVFPPRHERTSRCQHGQVWPMPSPLSELVLWNLHWNKIINA